MVIKEPCTTHLWNKPSIYINTSQLFSAITSYFPENVPNSLISNNNFQSLKHLLHSPVAGRRRFDLGRSRILLEGGGGSGAVMTFAGSTNTFFKPSPGVWKQLRISTWPLACN